MSGEEASVGDLHDVPVLQITSVVAPCQHHPTWAPGELVAQRVVVGIGRWQATTVGAERLDFSARLVHAVNDAFGRHVVNAGVNADFVEQNDPSLLCRIVQRPHRVADVTGCDHLLAVVDTLLGHLHVVDVG